jgi:hypothetical protein
LRSRNCFLALLYSILEAGRQRLFGGCTAFADDAAATMTNVAISARACRRGAAWTASCSQLLLPAFLPAAARRANPDLAFKIMNISLQLLKRETKRKQPLWCLSSTLFVRQARGQRRAP